MAWYLAREAREGGEEKGRKLGAVREDVEDSLITRLIERTILTSLIQDSTASNTLFVSIALHKSTTRVLVKVGRGADLCMS